MVEVAVINTRGEALFSELIRPTREVGEAVIRIHGITNEMLADKPTYDRVHDRLMRVLHAATAVCAWNAPFDRRLLEQSAAKYGLQLPHIRWRDLVTDHRVQCPSYTSHKLIDVAQRQGIAKVQDHRAMGDCRITLAVIRAQVLSS